MMEENVQERNDTAQRVSSMVTWYFVEAFKTENFYQTAVKGLVRMADSLLADTIQSSLNVVIGALARLGYTYHRPHTLAAMPR
jgi:hypothetical protein